MKIGIYGGEAPLPLREESSCHEQVEHPTKSGQKIGLYGGTFNPIHNGHIHIVNEFARRLGLDKILLIPSAVPPHKEEPGLIPGQERLKMCALAVEDIPGAEVSDIEFRRGGKSYSYETVTILKEAHPEDELYFLMGEDMFLAFEKWRFPEEITKRCAICASPRSNDGLCKLIAKKEELEKTFGAKCFIEDIPYLPVSSTEIRDRLERGESISDLVPKKVEEYLKKLCKLK